MAEPTTRPPVRWLVACGALLLVAAGAGAAAEARFNARTPPAPARTPVTAPVLRKVLEGVERLSCEPVQARQAVELGRTMVVTATSASGPIEAGGLVVELEGRPVFLLEGDLPLYRDLAPGAIGPDVAVLRSALDALGYGSPGDRFDATTSAALAAFYRDRGHDAPPTGPEVAEAAEAASTTYEQLASTVEASPAAVAAARQRAIDARSAIGVTARRAELVVVPPGGARAARTHARGSQVEGWIEVLIGPTRLTCTLPYASEVEAGDLGRVAVASGATDEAGVVVSSVESGPATSAAVASGGDAVQPQAQPGTGGGVERRAVLDARSPGAPLPDAAREVEVVTATSGEPVLVVPQVAVRGGDGAPSVVVVGATERRTVPVEVRLVAGGEVAVVAADLQEGDAVVAWE